MSEPNPENEWTRQLDEATGTNQLLPILQDLASQEDVRGIARRCLELLAHKESEIRVWAAEALESAARPDAVETEELTQWLAGLLDQQAAVTKKPFVWPGAEKPAEPAKKPEDDLAISLLADQLYWTATMLGRIGPDAASAVSVLARLEKLSEDVNAKPFHDAAARAKVMRTRCTA
ncbi:uncharacterized protein (UPF0147 family) [Rhodopirellula rubra]|uniref:Uncharacterized protein (UPF0147 family) n=1 Tax=Aporhodopirellula rubra TaxID=980271 RepID=A0A7W5H3N3_9BACT|nr:hypothetical protein [Aporhodopirellula rubra]MBB3204504.1 uncharacterized protein (UPF0147 family) [Aporhodopirellula rubra]